MRAFVLIVLCFAAVAAVPKNPQRIVGGTPVNINQYPTITALLYSYLGITNFSQSCGGTIITTRSILTAGHCPHGDAPVRWRVRAGSTYSHSGGVVYTVESIIVHPHYNSRSTDNDVAILRTAERIEYNSVIQPASIAGTNYYLADNQVVWAAGWGTTQAGGSTSEHLQHVQIWSINQAICRDRYAVLGRAITDNMLCSGWLDVGGRDQCQGDSGGPLYHNGVLVGICSWGYSCATPHYPGVNTRVSQFTAWIQTNA